MKRFFSLFIVAIIFISSLSFGGCSPTTSDTKVIRVCNCEDYIDETLFDEFTQETGIEVQYSTYGTNENLYNELVINPNSYDLVVPSEYMIEKLAIEGRIQKLDFSRLLDYKANVSDYIKTRLENLKFTVEKGKYEGQQASLSEYMVGYMWGTMGWVYSTDELTVEDVNSWYSPFENSSLAKRITIKDAVRDSYIVGMAMAYEQELKNVSDNASITAILNNVETEAINKVGEKLQSLKPMLYGFEVDSGKNDIINNRIDAYVAWSGDAAYAIDVASGDAEDEDGNIVDTIRNLSYYIPDEGSNIWFDGFVMPSGSNNYDAVYKFLEFISRPDSVYRNMNYTGYTSMVAKGDFNTPIESESGDTLSNLFDAIVLDWFDESDDMDPETDYEVIDLSYFFGNDRNYTVTVSAESKGRLIAQYPTLEMVERCAIMQNFNNEALRQINDMWEVVKGETFPTWALILFAVLVFVIGATVVVYRNKEKIKWHKNLVYKKTALEKKGYRIIKIEEIE
ncbi:MAG: extracellular solute-binding protein [Clostridia bacterium]|nr:extracellular solute-binding protein [Clostridia bacterium]